MKIVATPGFLQHPKSSTANLPLIAGIIRANEPSWFVGDPALKETVFEDDGRTFKAPAKFRFWAIRDDYPEGAVVTFLLPEEY